MNNIQSTDDFFSRIGMTRNKFIAVCSLGLIFLLVLISQFSGGSETAVATASPVKNGPSQSGSDPTRKTISGESKPESISTKSPSVKIDNASATSSEPSAPSKLTSIPRAKAKDFEAVDPFSIPAEIEKIKKEKAIKEAEEKLAAKRNAELQIRRTRQAQIRQTINSLKSSGVKMVYTSGNKRIALIGDQTVSVGDRIGGIEITEIRDNGTVLVKLVEGFLPEVDPQMPDNPVPDKPVSNPIPTATSSAEQTLKDLLPKELLFGRQGLSEFEASQSVENQ